MQQQEYPQLNEFGLGSLVSDFFDNVADTVKGVAKAVAPIAPFIIPFAAPALAGTGIGSLLGGGVGRFLTSKVGQAALGAGIQGLAGKKPADIAKNLALQVATSGVRGALSGKEGTFGQKFMSGVTGRDVQIPTGDTQKGFFSKLSPSQRATNPRFTQLKKLGFEPEEIIASGVSEEAPFTYQYGPALYAGLTALPLAEQLFSPQEEEEEEEVSVGEDLYTPNYAQYQLLDITGPQGYDPTIYAVAEGGEITGGVANNGRKIKHPDGKIKEHPKRIGEIAGPGTGTSDDIPAMLSDGEFVMTAKAVRNAGGGSRKQGAKNMYKMMKSLENGGSLSQQSIGMA
jgi:hypothetical protein